MHSKSILTPDEVSQCHEAGCSSEDLRRVENAMFAVGWLNEHGGNFADSPHPHLPCRRNDLHKSARFRHSSAEVVTAVLSDLADREIVYLAELQTGVRGRRATVITLHGFFKPLDADARKALVSRMLALFGKAPASSAHHCHMCHSEVK